MIYNKFQPGTVIEINGAEYRFSGYSGDRLLLSHLVTDANYLHRQADGSLALPTNEDFNELLLRPDVALRSGGSANAIRNYNERSEWSHDDVAKVDKKALKRAIVCQLLDERGTPNGNQAIKKALSEIWTHKLFEDYGPAPSPRTVRSWRAQRGSVGDRHPRHMVALTGRKVAEVASTAINDQVLWKCVLVGRKQGLTVKDIHNDYVAEIASINCGKHNLIPQPDEPIITYKARTTRRRCEAIESSDTLASHIEKQANEQDWLGAGKPLTADFVMQRVIIDHTPLDLHVVCPKLEMVLGRPWLTLVIDVKSRAVVGHVITFMDPCAWTLGEALRRTALPKRPPWRMAERYPILCSLRGKFFEVIVDNGVDLRGHNMEAAARNIGFSVMICPIKQPRYRAICERAIKTVNQSMCKLLPGRTMSVGDARRLGYNAEDHAVVMLDELEAVANQIIAEYNTAPHSGIGGKQPAAIFQTDINRYGINNITDFDSYRRDTMEIAEDVQLSPSGIRLFGLRYHDIRAVPDLLNDLVPMEPRRRRRDDATATVHVRYDPADISIIHVWNRKNRKYVALQCADERYADGMPLWLHKKIQEVAKAEGAAFNTEEERQSMRGRLVQAIRSISPRALAESRKRVAQLLEIPRIKKATGNIVDLLNTNPDPVSLGDFISNDRAALTSLDHEILAPRPAPKKGRAKTALDHRREETDPAQGQLPPPERTRRNIAGRGGYA